MSYIEALKNEIIKGREISREEALLLYEQPLEELCAGADEIVKHAKLNYELEVHQYSIVTSGKRISNDEVDDVCEAVRQIRHKLWKTEYIWLIIILF